MKTLFLLLSALLPFLSAHSLETDQFVNWLRPLEDGNEVLSRHMQSEAQEALKTVNSRLKSWHQRRSMTVPPKGVGCSAVVDEIVKRYFKQGVVSIVSRLETWAHNTPLLDRYPNRPGRSDSAKWTYHRDDFRVGLIIVGVSIKIGDVHMGIDKLDHVVSVGNDYIKKYLKSKKAGANHKEAMIDAIKFGVMQENTYYGLNASGIFSRADLEANYQGVIMFEDMCSQGIFSKTSENFITYTNGQWKWDSKKVFDFSKYVTPYLDESYYSNFITYKKLEQVAPYVLPYCTLLDSPTVLEQVSLYDRLARKKNFNIRYLEKLVKANKIPRGDDKARSMEIKNLCSDALKRLPQTVSRQFLVTGNEEYKFCGKNEKEEFIIDSRSFLQDGGSFLIEFICRKEEKRRIVGKASLDVPELLKDIVKKDKKGPSSKRPWSYTSYLRPFPSNKIEWPKKLKVKVKYDGSVWNVTTKGIAAQISRPLSWAFFDE